ncbi:MAG: hypothetical protein ACJ78Q_08830 [Chloroflexia bacterium]
MIHFVHHFDTSLHPKVVPLLLLAALAFGLGGCDFGDPGGQPTIAQVADATVTATYAASPTPPATATTEPPSPSPVATETPPPPTASPTPVATATKADTPTVAATATPLDTPTREATATQEAPSAPAPTAISTYEPTLLPRATQAEPSPTDTPEEVLESKEQGANPTPIVVNGRSYDVYLPAATKKNQVYHYSCEFDAAWVVLKTYGFDVSLDEQLAIVGVDESIEPYYKETAKGIFIYGGDIINSYSGNYKTNFLARTTGFAMRRLFEHYGLKVAAVRSQAALEVALRRGELVWIKTTADFKPGKPSTWVMPDGSTYQTVLGNDHAAVVMGYNSDGALIRDVLGPTSTNWQRKYEYLVPWPKFLAAWASQSYDGLAVAPPASR